MSLLHNSVRLIDELYVMAQKTGPKNSILIKAATVHGAGVKRTLLQYSK